MLQQCTGVEKEVRFCPRLLYILWRRTDTQLNARASRIEPRTVSLFSPCFFASLFLLFNTTLLFSSRYSCVSNAIAAKFLMLAFRPHTPSLLYCCCVFLPALPGLDLVFSNFSGSVLCGQFRTENPSRLRAGQAGSPS